MTSLLVSAQLRSASWSWAVDDEGLRRDGDLVAPAGDWTLTCVLDRGHAPPLVGAAEAHVLTVDGDHLVPVDGFEHADGREQWYTPWGGPPDVRSMAIADDGTIFVNVHVGGILRSLDGGATWHETIDKDVDVHQVLVDRDLVFAACGDRGLAVSRDGGDTWEVRTDGLDATYCRAVAVGGDTVVVTASPGPHSGGPGAVYRGDRNGGAFERSSDFFDFNIDTFQLAASGDDAAFGTRDGEVYRSSDAGRTWQLVEKGDPVRCVAFV